MDKQSQQCHAELGYIILPSEQEKGVVIMQASLTLVCQPISMLSSNITAFKCQHTTTESMGPY